ncbi:MAG TPA: heme-binding protein [Pirellulales bacterium]|nr:heme-binding protein [Pirellulales bacterium]
MFSVIRTVALFPVLLTVVSVGAAAPPRPHWMWAAKESLPATQRACFRKTFSAPEGVEKASFLLLADDRATLYVDGEVKGEAIGHERVTNLTCPLSPGEHVLAVETKNEAGAAGLLIRLELQAADGSRQWLSSDATWLVTTRPQDGWQSPDFHADGWSHAIDLGPLGIKPWGDPTGEIDDYHQWKQAITGQATDPATIAVPQGFEIELLRTALPEEGSWISIDFDPQGRLVIAREDRGLLRFTFPSGEGEIQVETINEDLLECRGLLHAYDSLYVNANNSKALYRLRDTDGDDRFDRCDLLRETEGGVGHGRNDLALGPDGMIYLIHGNNVRLSGDLPGPGSPLRHFAEDHLLRCTWDAAMFDSDVRAPGGHLLRTDRDGRRWELVAGGLRNCYGIDFNADGELFSYESDMEWDVGLPWYRPTRVLHLVSGGDYGYRQGTKMWPAWSPDAAPSSLNIGKGSPTGVKFATPSHFPPPYRRALFILDWAYGRVFAVHLTPQGAGYDCRSELFIKGRPLNVTDLDFGADGAMYFVVGGRRTQSALYRVRYVGSEIEEPLSDEGELARDGAARRARALRHTLEPFHGRADPHAVDVAWPHLDSRDVWVRQAARIAVESQPVEQWLDRALHEERPTAALTALMALARVADKSAQNDLLSRLEHFYPGALDEEQQLIALRAFTLALLRLGQPEAAVAARWSAIFEAAYPTTSPRVNGELCELLVTLESPSVVSKTLPLVLAAKTQEERLRYLFALRNVRQRWSLEERREYFEWLRRPEAFSGAHTMPLVLQNVRNDAVACLSEEERAALAPLLAAENSADSAPQPAIQRPFVWDWKLADLVDSLDQLSAGRNFDRGRDVYRAALCDRCHRLAGSGTTLGPDLTGCGNRFGRRDLLETVLSPSKFVDEKYRPTAIELTDGKLIVGRITGDDGKSLTVATNPLDSTQLVSVSHGDIESRTPSLLSPMPSGLLNTLSKDEILDLLAYLIADGLPDHPSFAH